MESYLIYFSLLWALGIILMGLFVRMRSKHKFSDLDNEKK
tara:strand:+ start:279 stop:398 length:120 start_codon:yes stop_codon:yes gene_type:complete